MSINNDHHLRKNAHFEGQVCFANFNDKMYYNMG